MIAFLVLLALVLLLGAVVAVGVLLERRMHQLATDVNRFRYDIASFLARAQRVPSAPTGSVPYAVAEEDAAPSGRPPGAERTTSTGRTLPIV